MKRGLMTFSAGCCKGASSICTMARYESPIIPTLPLDHGWATIQSSVS